jgi:hypothetical protein
VVVTDLAMPGMDGPTFIRALHGLNPQVRIIAVSGLQSWPALPGELETLVQARLLKPFSALRLLETLQCLLRPEAPPKD